jgi:hypothetical protein
LWSAQETERGLRGRLWEDFISGGKEKINRVVGPDSDLFIGYNTIRSGCSDLFKRIVFLYSFKKEEDLACFAKIIQFSAYFASYNLLCR